MLSDGRFWIGVVVGVGLLYAYGRYQAKKAAQ